MDLLLVAIAGAAVYFFARAWVEAIIRVIRGDWSMLRGRAMDPHHEYVPTGKWS